MGGGCFFISCFGQSFDSKQWGMSTSSLMMIMMIMMMMIMIAIMTTVTAMKISKVATTKPITTKKTTTKEFTDFCLIFVTLSQHFEKLRVIKSDFFKAIFFLQKKVIHTLTFTFCYLRNLVCDQRCPLHPLSESRGCHLSRTNALRRRTGGNPCVLYWINGYILHKLHKITDKWCDSVSEIYELTSAWVQTMTISISTRIKWKGVSRQQGLKTKTLGECLHFSRLVMASLSLVT